MSLFQSETHRESGLAATLVMNGCRIMDNVQSRVECGCTYFISALRLCLFREPASFGGAALV